MISRKILEVKGKYVPNITRICVNIQQQLQCQFFYITCILKTQKNLISDPYGKVTPCQISHQGDSYRLEFLPPVVGTYKMDVRYAGQPIPNNPFICSCYDTQKVKIVDCSPAGMVGQELCFTGKLALVIVLLLSFTGRLAVVILLLMSFTGKLATRHCAKIYLNPLDPTNLPFNLRYFPRIFPNSLKISPKT